MRMRLPAARAAAMRLPILRRLQGHAGEEGAAMMFALMAIFIAATLSLLILGTIVSQTRGSQFDTKNTRTIHAAEAGLDAALSQIRAAKQPADVEGNTGNRALLPCSVTGAAQTDGNLTYSVDIQYFTSDPSLQTKAWRAGNRIACTPGGGPVLLPHYALLVSDGQGSSAPGLSATTGDRQLESIYDFSIRNEVVSSGVISNWGGGVCWDAGAATPAAGAEIRTLSCDDRNTQQLWAWRADYTIVLVKTLQAPYATPLCASVETTSVTSRRLLLTNCSRTVAATPAAVAALPWNTKFGYNGRAKFQVNQTTSTAFCPFQVTSGASPGQLRATSANCAVGQNAQTSWVPSATLGAGSVGDKGDNVSDVDGLPLQWVNYEYFGQCFDITGGVVGSAAHILYTCKQEPGATVDWNEIFTWSASPAGGNVGRMVARNGSLTYCVTGPSSPGTGPSLTSNISARRITVVGCNTNATQQWTMNRLIPGNYHDSYTIVNRATGYCLAAVPPYQSGFSDSAPYYAGNISPFPVMVAEPCNGSGRQKWNAPPDPSKSTQRDTVEVNN